jgi:hypothetical protein
MQKGIKIYGPHDLILPVWSPIEHSRLIPWWAVSAKGFKFTKRNPFSSKAPAFLHILKEIKEFTVN